jgi:uncharacterized membrane protein YfcA
VLGIFIGGAGSGSEVGMAIGSIMFAALGIFLAVNMTLSKTVRERRSELERLADRLEELAQGADQAD